MPHIVRKTAAFLCSRLRLRPDGKDGPQKPAFLAPMIPVDKLPGEQDLQEVRPWRYCPHCRCLDLEPEAHPHKGIGNHSWVSSFLRCLGSGTDLSFLSPWAQSWIPSLSCRVLGS